jgi:nucleotide-binding universal stress UspA family protein
MISASRLTFTKVRLPMTPTMTMQTEPTREELAVPQPSLFRNVFVGVDGTPTGRDAIALAERLRARGGQLTLAHVVLRQSPTYRNFHDTPVWKDRRAMLAREGEAIGVTAELTGTFAESVASGLHQLAADHDVDLLVVGSSSRGVIGRVLVGNDARAAVSRTTGPVAVAPHGYADRADQIRTIGVAFDGSAEANASLAVARELADAKGARLLALTVVSPVPGASGDRADPGATPDLLRSLEGVEGRVAIGAPAVELVAFGDQVDLLIVGSRRRGRLRRLIFGSTSLQLTREARCPLLIIPGPVAERASDADS